MVKGIYICKNRCVQVEVVEKRREREGKGEGEGCGQEGAMF